MGCYPGGGAVRGGAIRGAAGRHTSAALQERGAEREKCGWKQQPNCELRRVTGMCLTLSECVLWVLLVRVADDRAEKYSQQVGVNLAGP